MRIVAASTMRYVAYAIQGMVVILFVIALVLAFELERRWSVGLLVLDLPDSKAKVRIDGDPIDVGSGEVAADGSVFVKMSLPRGEHTVQISEAGFETYVGRAIVGAGQITQFVWVPKLWIYRFTNGRAGGEGPKRDPGMQPEVPAAREDDKKARLAEGNGNWVQEGDELYNSDDNDKSLDHRIVFGDTDWTDYEFSCDVCHEGTATAVALLVRSPDSTHSQIAGIGWENFQTAILQYRNGACLFNKLFRDGTPIAKDLGKPVKTSNWYSLKVRVAASNTKVYCDGQEILSFDDAPFPWGRVGLCVYRKWPGKTRFRKLLVVGSDGQILWKGPPDVSSLSASRK